MSKTVTLEIITPSKMFYKGSIELVSVKTTLGMEGFMADHAWACKLLGTGPAKIREADGTQKVAFMSGGFIDIKENIMIYTDAAEWAGDIDAERAMNTKREAEAFIESNKARDKDDPEKLPDDHPDLVFARFQIEKSDIRMRIAGNAAGGDSKTKPI